MTTRGTVQNHQPGMVPNGSEPTPKRG